MGSAISKNEKKNRSSVRIKTPPDLRRLSTRNVDSVRSSPSEINVTDLGDDIDLEFVDVAALNETDSRKLIEKIWKIIEKQRNAGKKLEKSNEISTNTNDVVRVFVSSTFVDCHSERNVLVKEVFPELKDWCAENGLNFVDVDLRWGVPAETSTSGTIEICMRVLDECSSETKGQPFFIGLLGDRYGWVPSKESLTDDLRRDNRWIPNVSITTMEMLRGAYRNGNSNAVFFFRDSSSLTNVPSEYRHDFEENIIFSKLQIQELKKRLKTRFPDQCHDYHVNFEGLDESSGRKMVKFSGYETFVENVKMFLKRRITETFSLSNLKQDAFDGLMIRRQKQFVQDTPGWFVGRTNELKSLQTFADGFEPTTCTKMPCKINDDTRGVHLYGKLPWSDEDSTNYLYVRSPSGYGKSCLLAEVVAGYLKNKPKNGEIFYQFIGLDDASTNEEQLLQRLIKFCGLENEPLDGKERDALIEIWKTKALPKLAEAKEKRFVVVLDALDKTSWYESPQHLKWLPHRFPTNVRCVVSSGTEHMPTTFRLEQTGPYLLDLSTLSTDEQTLFVEANLSRFGKKLDDSQTKVLLSKDRTPIWLSLACEELRVFGDFRNVTRKIESLPDDLIDLSWYIVRRLIDEDDDRRKNVEKFLKFLAAESNGFYENYVPSLLGSFDDAKPAPYTDWYTIKVRLKPFLRFKDGLIDFKHWSLRKAAEKNFLSNAKNNLTLYSSLADFYDKFCRSNQYLMGDRYPTFLIRSQRIAEAVRFIFVDSYGRTATQSYKKRDFFKDLRCRNSIMAIGQQQRNNAYVCNSCLPSAQFMDICVVCNISAMCQPAQLCMQHNQPYLMRCVLCNSSASTVAKLCTFCNFGIPQCCQMLP